MWGRVDDNISAVERLMSVVGAAELYVLPEMWATGFAATSPDEACSDVPLDWMIRTARERFCAVCGSVAVRDDGGIFRNRHYFVMPDGSYHYYDKRHLFRPGGETDTFTPSSLPCLRGHKIKCINADGSGIGRLVLTDCTTGEEHPVERIVENYPKRLTFQFPPGLPAGEYTLSIETYYTTNPSLLKKPRCIVYGRPLVLVSE